MIATHGVAHPVLIAQAIAAAEAAAARISHHRHAVPGAGQAPVALKAEEVVVQAAVDAGKVKKSAKGDSKESPFLVIVHGDAGGEHPSIFWRGFSKEFFFLN